LNTLAMTKQPGDPTGRLEYPSVIVSHAFDDYLMLALLHLVSQSQGQVAIIGQTTRQAVGPLGLGGTGAVEKRIRRIGV
jgi:hypothetical protein